MNPEQPNLNGFDQANEEAEIMNEIKAEEARKKDQERFNELSGMSDEEIEANGKNIDIDDEGRVIEVE